METKKMTYMQAIRLALDEEMARDEKVIMMGQDIGILGGAYGVTGDLYHKYGPDRVIDAPLSENAIVGFGIGAAMRGWRPIIDIMKMDFSMCALDPIVNHLAKYRYMSGGQISCMPAVVRTVIGGGTRSGPHHSQSVYSLYAGFPGLKVVCASTPEDAKGLLKAALRDDDPVFFCEEAGAYRMKAEVPLDPDFVVPIGKSKVVCEGDDLTVVGFGTAILKATKAAEQLREEGIHMELIDLRSLRPLDLDPVAASVRKTGKLLLVDEFTETYGITGEIAFQVSETCFEDLKMPVQRCTLPDTIIPAAPTLEDWVMLSPEKIAVMAKEMINA
ncbi:alpha-ketoacid dehydrogenase subunit beta [Emergencia timonensis]|uniref:alpha-ketoacid dehydrogenase subunit beta n=1 Tax=Emergencia timonensis TaxID=1776384 RepID=UPI003992DBC8